MTGTSFDFFCMMPDLHRRGEEHPETRVGLDRVVPASINDHSISREKGFWIAHCQGIDPSEQVLRASTDSDVVEGTAVVALRVNIPCQHRCFPVAIWWPSVSRLTSS